MGDEEQQPKRISIAELSAAAQKFNKVETDTGLLYVRTPTAGDYKKVRSEKLDNEQAGMRLMRLLLSKEETPASREGLSEEEFSGLSEAAVQMAFEEIKPATSEPSQSFESIEALGKHINNPSWPFSEKYLEGMKAYKSFLNSETMASVQKMLDMSDQNAKAIARAIDGIPKIPPEIAAAANAMKLPPQLEEIIQLQNKLFPPGSKDSLGKFDHLRNLGSAFAPPLTEPIIGPGALKPEMLVNNTSSIVAKLHAAQEQKQQRMDNALDSMVSSLTTLMTNVQELTTTFVGQVFPQWAARVKADQEAADRKLMEERKAEARRLQDAQRVSAEQARGVRWGIWVAAVSVIISCVTSIIISVVQYRQSDSGAKESTQQAIGWQNALEARDQHRDALLSEQLQQVQALRTEISNLVEVNRQQAQSISLLMDKLAEDHPVGPTSVQWPDSP